ncbi:LysR family transcriptional regulator [Paenibacillus sp. J5C_2022]|uniref:LysR family transcriptional regulator n=1 Tax=Paenibacillus sp. J5C2022 TaxID=2977129 RepID=UPI0021D1E5EB|nr:LysR family transcriptional regulator [Paenibacillus sp. J5C2022]MCU6708663.1 LysR family transcriptional regulator [Paenibacillus sp. J5C2022]
MNTKKLEIILLIAQYRKVSAVADILGMKQPTVTFHMKSLEKQYGVKLFESRGGGMMLTEAGKALLHYAGKMTALANETERVLREYRKVERGTIVIGASYVPGTYMLPGMISNFSFDYPGVSMKLLIKPAPVIQQLLLEHEIDLGFVSSQPFREDKLKTHFLCSDELVVVFSAEHRLARLTNIQAEDIAKEPFILHGTKSTTRRMTEQWSEAHQLQLSSSMELDSLESIKRALMLGAGISFISRQAVTEEVKHGLLAYAPLPAPYIERNIYAGYHRDRWLSQGLQAFIDRVLQADNDGFSGDCN